MERFSRRRVEVAEGPMKRRTAVCNGHFDEADLTAVVKGCTHSRSAGSLLSTSKAIEELRVISGDFVTSDEEMADAISRVAIALGCTVVFDEQPGADTLSLPPQRTDVAA
jgi:hypothetical protein